MKLASIAWAATLSLALASPSHAADGPITAWFAGSSEEVSATLANMCAEHNSMVIEQDAYHLVCSRQDSSLKGTLAQVLIGNSYSTTPELKVRFSLLKQGVNTKVLASQWIETVMAFGQVRTVPLTSVKHSAALRDAMMAAGGSYDPPSTGAAFTKDNPLIIQVPAAPATSTTKTP